MTEIKTGSDMGEIEALQEMFDSYNCEYGPINEETLYNAGITVHDAKYFATLHNAVPDLLAALRAQAERENPKPLTLEELREMDGEPVYCVYPGCSTGGEWFLVNSQGACKNGGFLNFRHYGEWLAYRHKPEEVQA